MYFIEIQARIGVPLFTSIWGFVDFVMCCVGEHQRYKRTGARELVVFFSFSSQEPFQGKRLQ